jgi:hypothetical protein
LGRRSRKRAGAGPAAVSAGGAAEAEPRGSESDRFARARARSEARNAAARARLQPLAPGERPTVVTIAAVVALALAIGNVAFLIAGVEVRGHKPAAGGVVLLSALMLVAAVGLWRARYWAVLGFEVLLALTILYATLSLTVASNWAAVLLCIGLVGLGGLLFWKLVRAMARIQMPERRPRTRDG